MNPTALESLNRLKALKTFKANNALIFPIFTSFSFLTLFIFLPFSPFLTAVAVETPAPLTPQQIEFFEKQVRPVLAEKCFSCHGAEKQKGGLRLDSRAALLKGGDDNGPALIIGNPDKSPLILAIRQAGELKMPKKGEKLGVKEIAALTEWVKLGAPWPGDAKGDGGKEKGEAKHWAWQPVTNPTLPKVKNPKWTQSPIDYFILAKLEAKKLEPAKPADRRTLMRRAYFDLLGLPPTYEEVETFVADKSPDAFAKVVDHLLASPRYGERWGRYWLDVARYSDTKGYVFEEERRYPYSYTYRDWVIRALNEDLPYDQFLRFQIAADKLVKPDDPSPLAAMGFLTVGRRFLNNQPDVIDDRIDVVCRGTMALTVGCARCHDHKYDPIPTRDYYSLYGVFASSTEPKDLPLLGAPKRTEAYSAFERELQARENAANQFREARFKEHMAKLRTPAQIASYLLTARAAQGKTEADLKTLVQERDLNRYILGRWKTFLESTSAAHPIFGPWHELAALPDAEFGAKAPPLIAKISANSDPHRPVNSLVAAIFARVPPTTLQDVAERYGKLLGPLTRAERRQYFDIVDKNGNVVTVFREHDERVNVDEEALTQALVANAAPFDVPLGEAEKLFNRDDGNKLREFTKKIDEWKATAQASPPRAMVLNDLPQPVEPHVFKRGNPGNLGDAVPRQFLEVLSRRTREPFPNGSGRLDLAQAITSRDNPLTARVMVNRVWLHHFGAGLVRTPSDFGTRSDPPSHPELLDWLATNFMEQGWSLKKLHRLILLSAVYQQVSDDSPRARAVDPENMFLWHFHRQRLDFEAMRDALLAVSGKLDLAMEGPGVDLEKQPFLPRRTVYGFIERQNLPALFRTFDFASPDATSPQRFSTTVPQQALFMMNSPFVIEQARAAAKKAEVRSQKAEDRIPEIYRLVLGRNPTRDETKLALTFINSPNPQSPTPNPQSPISPAWQYGYGFYDATAKHVSFTPLPFWTGTAWQGSTDLPDGKLGWAMLTADGGHPGNDLQHAAIRRWIAPEDLVVDVKGKLEHPSPQGDGIRGYVVSSRAGELARWTILPTKSADTPVARIEVKKGDTIDFIVDMNGNLAYDDFLWTLRVKDIRDPANANPTRWNAKADFAGPNGAGTVFTPWEKLAQVLLLANEFLFVD